MIAFSRTVYAVSNGAVSGRKWRCFMVSIALICAPGMIFGQEGKEAHMNISSTSFIEGGNIPVRFTCDGKNTSPDLKIDGVPAGAKSLLLIVDDPDAPRGTFTHWLVWNLKPDVKEIPTGGVPEGVILGQNGFGRNGYGGPCPPTGIHRYYFRLYALDNVPHLLAGTERKAVDRAIEGHIIAACTLMGRYGRVK